MEGKSGCARQLTWLGFAVVILTGAAFLTLTLTGDSDDDQDRTEVAVGAADPDSSGAALSTDDPEIVVDEGEESGDAVDETGDSGVAVDESEDSGVAVDDGDDSAGDQLAYMAQPNAYIVFLDENGEAWVNIKFEEGWSMISLREYFSFFASISVTLNPTVELGWERHAGAETVLGTTSQAYILEDGSVLFATGLFPVAPFELKIAARFGSWLDEAGPPAAFGEDSITISSDSVETGDPLADIGGPPVFDLVAGVPAP